MKNPILVTGSHRSGTTWVGSMIAQSPDVHYIQEPFNVAYPPGKGICAAQFDYWYTQINSDNSLPYQRSFQRTISFSYNLLEALKKPVSRKRVCQILSEYREFLHSKILKRRALLKDPLALFSAEWLFEEFDTRNIVLIRHPAAFASSLKRKNWGFDFSHFIAQEQLFNDPNFYFRDEVFQHSRSRKSIIEQAILLWRILHSRISQYQQKYPGWLYVRHEDISMTPISEYEKIFSYLQLDFSQHIQQIISDHSGSQNPAEAQTGLTHVLRRDSKANIKSWQKRLTQAEIQHIYNEVQDVSPHFYTDSEWK